MTTPNEARAWAAAHSAHRFPYGSDGEYVAAIFAETSDHGVTTFGDTEFAYVAHADDIDLHRQMAAEIPPRRDIDRMLAAEDATAERHGNPIVAAASILVGAAFLVMVAVALWGWVA